MNLLYITQFFYPEITAGAFRAYENSQIWAREPNINLTIYTGNPNYPKGSIYEGYNNKWIEVDTIDDFKLIRSKSVVKKNTTKMGRIISALSFLIIGIINMFFYRKKIGKKFDVVLGTSGPIFTGILAYIFSRVYKAKFIFEIRDITYLQMAATTGKENTNSIRFMRLLELFLCKKSSKVIVVTEKFKEELINRGIKKEKIYVIYNGVTIDDKVEVYKDRFQNKLVLTYAGTIGISQQIKELIDFFEKIKFPNKELNIIGDGAQKESIKNYIQSNKLNNIRIYDALPKEELNDVLKDTVLGVVKLKYNNHFSATIPSKIFDLLNREIPILYLGPEGEASRIIIEANAGITLTTLNNEDNVQMIEKFLYEFSSQEINAQLETYTKQGKNFLKEKFDREILAKEYIQILKEVSNEEQYYIEKDLFTNL